MAARKLGMAEAPVIVLDYLSASQRRALVIADNRLAELAGWDRHLLAIELKELIELDLGFEIEITGFEMGEIDLLMLGSRGYSGVAYAFLGSVAGDLLRKAKCDVVVVPPSSRR